MYSAPLRDCFRLQLVHDAGLHLRRTRLAKPASEVIIKNLTSEAHISRYRGLTPAGFVRRVQALGPGLCVLGLDFHVAVLRGRAGGAVQLVHSSCVGTGAVGREAVDTGAALVSNYRVVGKTLASNSGLRSCV